MANTFLNIQQISRYTLPRLLDNLLMPNLCYKDFSEDFQNGKGNTVLIDKPIDFTAQDFDGSTVGGAGASYNQVAIQNITENRIAVKLDKMATVDVDWGSLVNATSMGEAKTKKILDGMAVALAEKINAEGMKMATLAGTVLTKDSSTTASLDDFGKIRLAMNKNRIATSGRHCVWDVESENKYVGMGSLVVASNAGDNKAMREGRIGSIFGMDNYMSQTVLSGTNTADTTGVVITAKEDVYDGGTEITRTKLTIGSDVSAKFKVGSIFTVGTGTNNYVCSAVTVSGTTTYITSNVPITESITTGTTVIKAPKSAFTCNFAFHEDSLAFISRPLIKPSSKESYVTSYNGLSLRVTRDYDILTKKEILSMDILYDYSVIRPEGLVTTVLY